MDTSPDAPGAGGKAAGLAQLPGRRYRAAGRSRPRSSARPTILRCKDQIGNDIVTSDGTTLLGADDKAGLAEIVDAMRFLAAHPEIKHGTIKVLFTPDEEIGRGVDKVDLARLGADFAYTIDGATAGNVEDETFSADAATVTVQGVTAHPGFAKGRMENAVKIAARIIDAAAASHLLAGDHRRPRRLRASDRASKPTWTRHAQVHPARLHRRRAEGQGAGAGDGGQGGA